jgi:hypothetical protein
LPDIRKLPAGLSGRLLQSSGKAGREGAARAGRKGPGRQEANPDPVDSGDAAGEKINPPPAVASLSPFY